MLKWHCYYCVLFIEGIDDPLRSFTFWSLSFTFTRSGPRSPVPFLISLTGNCIHRWEWWSRLFLSFDFTLISGDFVSNFTIDFLGCLCLVSGISRLQIFSFWFRSLFPLVFPEPLVSRCSCTGFSLRFLSVDFVSRFLHVSFHLFPLLSFLTSFVGSFVPLLLVPVHVSRFTSFVSHSARSSDFLSFTFRFSFTFRSWIFDPRLRSERSTHVSITISRYGSALHTVTFVPRFSSSRSFTTFHGHILSRFTTGQDFTRVYTLLFHCTFSRLIYDLDTFSRLPRSVTVLSFALVPRWITFCFTDDPFIPHISFPHLFGWWSFVDHLLILLWWSPGDRRKATDGDHSVTFDDSFSKFGDDRWYCWFGDDSRI